MSFLLSLLWLYGYLSPFSMSALQARFILSFSALVLTPSLLYHFKSYLQRFHKSSHASYHGNCPLPGSPTSLGLHPSSDFITVSIMTLTNSYQTSSQKREYSKCSYLSYNACPEGLGSFWNEYWNYLIHQNWSNSVLKHWRICSLSHPWNGAVMFKNLCGIEKLVLIRASERKML